MLIKKFVDKLGNWHSLNTCTLYVEILGRLCLHAASYIQEYIFHLMEQKCSLTLNQESLFK